MRFKLLYIIVLFQIAAFHSWGQSTDGILRRGDPKPEKGTVTTLTIDTNMGQGKTPEEQEKAKQDSIKQVNKKWEDFLTDKNNVIRQLLNSIQKSDLKTMAGEEIEEYRHQVNSLKRKIDLRIQSNGSWNDNDELNDLYASFLDDCDTALRKLDRKPPEKTGGMSWQENKLVILGVCFAALMVGIPIFTQLKAGRTMKKLQKQQELQAKKQAEEEERQRLLANEDNIIILKG